MTPPATTGVLGGYTEYASMAFGNDSLCLVAAAFYALSLLCVRGDRALSAPSQAPRSR